MNATSISSTRRYDIDWLRVLLILAVFIFHSMRFFDQDGWHIKNIDTYLGVQIVIVFLSRWMMPAIFLISGFSTFYALGKRHPGRFLKDRSLRLLIPLLVGLFTHVPLQGFLEEVHHAGYSGTFWQWYPSIFNGLWLFGGNFNWIGNHLWYLEVLFIFSLVCLPLFLWLGSGSGKRALAWLGEKLSAPGAVYLMILPTLLISFTLDGSNGSILTSEDFGGWNLPNHLIFFLSGFLLASSARMQASIRKLRWISLAAGIVIFAGGGYLAVTIGEAAFGTPEHRILLTISNTACWTWLYAILGFGMERLNFRSPLLDYANEAVLPFYVFHQTVLLAVGFFVVRWAVPDIAKWAVIASSSFVIIMLLYEFLVRRVNLLRVLFGMKPVHRERVVQRPAVQAR